MASPWPLTFSSGERPRALWALLLNINSNAVDCTCRDMCFKLAHDRLLTNTLLFTKNMSKTRKCMFCHINIETSDHLFIQCSFTKPLNRAVLYPLLLILDRYASLSFKRVRYFDFNVTSPIKNMLLLCFCMNPNTLWLYIYI